MTFEITDTRVLGRGGFLELCDVVVKGPDGEVVHRDVVHHPGGVGILAVDGTDVVLVKQYRVAVGTEILEIAAGKLDSPTESPADAARRELEEELGFAPVRLVSLGRMWPTPGYSDEVIHLFCADGVIQKTRRPDGVEEAHAAIVRIPVADIWEMIDRGDIDDAKTRIALMAWDRKRGS